MYANWLPLLVAVRVVILTTFKVVSVGYFRLGDVSGSGFYLNVYFTVYLVDFAATAYSLTYFFARLYCVSVISVPPSATAPSGGGTSADAMVIPGSNVPHKSCLLVKHSVTSGALVTSGGGLSTDTAVITHNSRYLAVLYIYIVSTDFFLCVLPAVYLIRTIYLTWMKWCCVFWKCVEWRCHNAN